MDSFSTLTPYILSWLFNYLVHSTVLLGSTSIAHYCGAFQSRRLAEIVWRLALVGGIVTASLQLGIQLSLQTSSNKDLVSPPQQVFNSPQPNRSADQGSLITTNKEVSSTPVAKTESIELFAYSRSNFELDKPSNNQVILLPANLQDLFSALVMTWLIYSVFVVAKITLGVHHLNRLANAMPVISRDDLDALLAQQLPKLDNSKRLRVSSDFNSPFVCPNGVICLPAWALEQSNQSLCYAMLHHEIQHIIRRDGAQRIANEIIKSIFFFQILNRVAEKQLTLLAEIDCDHIAVKANGVDTFAQALVRCAEMAVASKHPTFAIPMAKSTSLLQRIEFILDEDIMNKQTPREQNKLSSASSLALGLIAIASLSGVCYAMPAIGFAEASITKSTFVPATTTVQEANSYVEPSKLVPQTQIESKDNTEVVKTVAEKTNDDQPKNDVSLTEQPATANALNTTQANELEKAQTAYANKNFADALNIFRDLAKRGHTEAQFMAGDMLWRGEGSTVNPEFAMALLTQAANQGHVKAQKYTSLFAERAQHKAELDFYINKFDGGKFKWTEQTCERPPLSNNYPAKREYAEIVRRLNANLSCYNNYIASLKQSLSNGDYLSNDLRRLMRPDEIEQSKQLAQNIYFDMGIQAMKYSHQMLMDFDNKNQLWQAEISNQAMRNDIVKSEMEREHYARMIRPQGPPDTGVRFVITSNSPSTNTNTK